MKRVFKIIFSFSILSMLLILGSCKTDNKDDVDNNIVINEDSIDIQKQMDQAKEIFYSLPAPNEVATFLIQNEGTYFDKEILNSIDKSYNYTTEASQAYNLGVYSADLSYASLFDQNQVVINYMATSKKLAEQLGILEAFGQETIDKLEANVNNRDEVMRIISESFMDSDAYLQENNRHEIGAMVLIGGWIEGVYLAIMLSDKEPESNIPLTSSILEQQLSLELMIMFLDDFQGTDSKLGLMKDDMYDLYDVYSKIQTNVTDDGYLTVSKAEFTEICDKIIELRDKIIKLS